jgi:polygalacturonase
MKNSFMKHMVPAAAGASALVLGACMSVSDVHTTPNTAPSSAYFDVKSFGAIGDGRAIDTDAINKAIDAANAAGGGTVRFSAGTYASYSIHLKSNVTLLIDRGATILAAEPAADLSVGYDAPEPNAWDPYEDFGHSHFHNSLIWGEHIENVAIVGFGRIYGLGLSRGSPRSLRDQTPEERAAGTKAPATPKAANAAPIVPGPFGYPGRDTLRAGIGNKAISLRECHNVTLRDFTIYHGGHFGILATGVDNFTIDNLRIDTNRDGMDINSCYNVHVSNCSVNSPIDDGICLKSDYALGGVRACENITITNCHVSGFNEGTFLNDTFLRNSGMPGVPSSPIGRIKLGTEGSGGYKNIAISNCTFDYCCGLALEEVDGASLEDVSISNLTMRDITNSAIYIRLGSRDRSPPGVVPGVLRRVSISHVVASNVDPRFSSIIEGIPGHDIEGLRLSDIRIVYAGGGTKEDAALDPKEDEKGYPEPERMGHIPAYGFFVRHVKDVSFRDIDVSYAKDDARPAFILKDVSDADFDHIKAGHADGTPTFVLKEVSGFAIRNSPGIPDTRMDQPVADGKL